MFHLDVMNKTVANFHKNLVTTFKVHTVFYGTALYTFSSQHNKHNDKFGEIIANTITVYKTR